MSLQRVLRDACLVVCLWSASISGCKSPTETDKRSVERRGETTGGRAFQIIREAISEHESRILIAIDGETELHLGNSTPSGFPTMLIDSVEVFEYAGDPTLVHIVWNVSWYSLSSTNWSHYRIFPIGRTDHIMFEGTSPYNDWGHYGYSWRVGEYDLTYEGNRLTLIEHWKTCPCPEDARDSTCDAQETQRTRRYGVSAASVVGGDCEILRRTADFSVSDCVYIPNNLTPFAAEWEAFRLSPNDRARYCSPLSPEFPE